MLQPSIPSLVAPTPSCSHSHVGRSHPLACQLVPPFVSPVLLRPGVVRSGAVRSSSLQNSCRQNGCITRAALFDNTRKTLRPCVFKPCCPACRSLSPPGFFMSAYTALCTACTAHRAAASSAPLFGTTPARPCVFKPCCPACRSLSPSVFLRRLVPPPVLPALPAGRLHHPRRLFGRHPQDLACSSLAAQPAAAPFSLKSCTALCTGHRAAASSAPPSWTTSARPTH